MRKYAESLSAFLFCAFVLSTALNAKEYLADHCLRVYCKNEKANKVKGDAGQERTYSAYYDGQSGSYKLEGHQEFDVFERCHEQYKIDTEQVFGTDAGQQESKAPLVAIDFLGAGDRIKPNNRCTDAFLAANCVRLYCTKDVSKKIKTSEGHGRVFSAYYDGKSKRYIVNSSEYGAAQIVCEKECTKECKEENKKECKNKCREEYIAGNSHELFGTDADKSESIAPWVTIKRSENDIWIERNPRCGGDSLYAKNCLRIYCRKDAKTKLRNPKGHGEFFSAYYDSKGKRYIVDGNQYKETHGVCEKQYNIGESDALFGTDADARESIAPWVTIKRAEEDTRMVENLQCGSKRD